MPQRWLHPLQGKGLGRWRSRACSTFQRRLCPVQCMPGTQSPLFLTPQALLHSSHMFHEAQHTFAHHGIKVSGLEVDVAQMMAQKVGGLCCSPRQGWVGGVEPGPVQGSFMKRHSLELSHCSTARHPSGPGGSEQSSVADPALICPRCTPRLQTKAVTGLTKGIEGLFKKNKVTYVKGWGSLKSGNEVEVAGADGETSTIKAKNILIATGSEVTPLRGVEIDEEKVVSSTGILELKEVPKKLVVVGGGIIGLEMGSVWARLGAEVTVVEFLDNILPSIVRLGCWVPRVCLGGLPGKREGTVHAEQGFPLRGHQHIVPRLVFNGLLTKNVLPLPHTVPSPAQCLLIVK